MRARHACAFDTQGIDFALVFAHVFDSAAQFVAQRFDLLGRETEMLQLGRDRLLSLFECLAAVAVLLGQRSVHLVVQAADGGEALERLDPQLSQRGSSESTAVASLVAIFFLIGNIFQLVLGSLGSFDLGRRLIGPVLVDQAIDQLVDAHLFGFDLGHHVKNLGDRIRTGRDGLNHVLQAFLDALGDLDLALAGKQVDRAHLAHVHANRISRPAKLAVGGGQGCLGFLDGVFVGHRRGRIRA